MARSMRVAAFTEFGSPEHFEIRERPDPEPGPGEVVLDIEAASINRHDLSLLQAPSPLATEDDLPYVTGLDAAGVVAETGDGANVDAGDRVLLCPNQTCGSCRYCREGPENLCRRFNLFHGALAERAAVPADRLVGIPDDVDMATAAALPTAYMTAYHMLRRTETGPTDLVLVPGATGGVGVAGIQLADAMGAESIGTSTSERKLDQLRELGVDHTVESGDPDGIRDAVRNLNEGPVDAVLNHLGGEYTQMGLDLMRRGGRMAICGRTAGAESEIDVQGLFLGHKHVIGSTMGTQGDLETLVSLVADGAFEPPIGEEYDLASTQDAFEAMQTREAFGKLVVRP
jgi:NADPH2:quinone reductase